MKFKQALNEKKFELNKGDKLGVGKYRNKEVEIKDFDTDENGQPTINTVKTGKKGKGQNRKVYAFKVKKLFPKKEQ